MLAGGVDSGLECAVRDVQVVGNLLVLELADVAEYQRGDQFGSFGAQLFECVQEVKPGTGDDARRAGIGDLDAVQVAGLLR